MDEAYPVETLGTPETCINSNAYRETTYQFIWGTERHSLLLLEPKMLRCIREGPYAPYSIHYLVLSQSGRAQAYSTPEMQREVVEYGERYLDPSFKDQLLSDHDTFSRQFRSFLLGLAEVDFPNLSDHSLDDHYERYFNFLIETYTFFALTFGWKLEKANQALRAILDRAFPNREERVEAEVALATPSELDEISRERVAWLTLMHNHRLVDALSEETILDHARSFPWLVFNSYDVADIVSFFQMKFLESRRAPTEPLEEIRQLRASKRQLRDEQQRILAQLDDASAVDLAHSIRWASATRLSLKWFWAGCEFLALDMLREISARAEIPIEDFVHTYKRADIRRLLLDGVRLDRSEIRRRRRYVAYLVTERKLFFYSGDKALALLSSLVDPEEATSELRGKPAFLGRAAGRVRIIKVSDVRSLQEDFRRFEHGDVLVTTMTQPNIMMLIERASAVLTDEGGLTSHAAVICRELGLPCILGLHKATRVLRDGDLVEVDAINGIVRRVDELSPEWQTLANQGRSAARRTSSGEPSSPPTRAPASDAVHRTPAVAPLSPEAPWTLWLEEVGRGDRELVGGKAANLGELTSITEISKGFCVTSRAYSRFLELNELEDQLVPLVTDASAEDPLGAEKISKTVVRFFQTLPMPDQVVDEILARIHELGETPVAVRSSAGGEDSSDASFAGQHDTFLNRSGPEAILESIRSCWASLYSARAIFYRKRKNLPPIAAPMAILVQQMVDADYAGVLFTVNPVNHKDQLIEVIQGLGEALVSGHTTPDRYIVSRDGGRILERESTFPLPDSEVLAITDLGKIVENHFDQPMDIEFAVRQSRLYLLQARPITTL